MRVPGPGGNGGDKRCATMQHSDLESRGFGCVALVRGASQTRLRVVVVGLLLAVIHSGGVLLSVLLLVRRLLNPDDPDGAGDVRVCTTAVLCPAFAAFDADAGLTGLAVQMVGSVCGLTLNLLLLLGAVGRLAWPLLLWLLWLAN